MKYSRLSLAGLLFALSLVGGLQPGSPIGTSYTVSAQAPPQPVQPPAQAPPSVTFQTEVNYVDVDAIVTDSQGNFVSGLAREDFDVFEDGKPQKIDTFSTVNIPVERRDRFLFQDKPVTSDVKSNREIFAGRVYVIVLDDFDISPMRSGQTKKAAREFVEKYLGANDVAAVVYTSGRTDAVQEFTGDPQLLLAAIDKFVGKRLRAQSLDRIDQYYNHLAVEQNMTDDPSSTTDDSGTSITAVGKATDMADPTDFERGYRARGVLNTIKNLADFLTSVRGRRKAMVMLSEGIDYPMLDVFGSQNATDVLRAVQDAISAAAKANVNIFTIDPRGLVGMTTEWIEMEGSYAPQMLGSGVQSSVSGATLVPFNGQQDLLTEMRMSQDSLRVLADNTGGFASLNRNSFGDAFDRIVKANSEYYVLGYYPPTHPRDGKFHKIEVKMKRQGLKVAARKGYASPRGKTPEERQRDEEAQRAREAKAGGANNTSPALREVLNSPMQQGGLTFSVQAAPFKGTEKDRSSIALAMEFDGAPFQFTQQQGIYSDKLELSFFSVSEQGKPQQGTRSELNLTLRPETYQRVKASGVRLSQRISLPPGRYQMRIGGRESNAGVLGAVFYDLQVPDFSKEPLMMSGVLIASPSTERTPTAQPDPVVGKLLPGAATSQRDFLQTDTLALLAEIYDNSQSQQQRQIDTIVHLIGETGQDAFAAHDTLTNGGDTKKWDVYAYAREVPLQGIAPGRYLLRVEAQVRGNNGAKSARETLITIH